MICENRCARFLCSCTGCTKKLEWGKFQKHEQFCTFRKIQCIGNSCKRLIKTKSKATQYSFCDSVTGATSGTDQNYSLKIVLLIVEKKHQYMFVIALDGVLAGVYSVEPILHNIEFQLLCFTIT